MRRWSTAHFIACWLFLSLSTATTGGTCPGLWLMSSDCDSDRDRGGMRFIFDNPNYDLLQAPVSANGERVKERRAVEREREREGGVALSYSSTLLFPASFSVCFFPFPLSYSSLVTAWQSFFVPGNRGWQLRITTLIS